MPPISGTRTNGQGMDAQSSGTLQSSSHTDSSTRTTGSKRTESGSTQPDKDRDLSRDNAASPIDLECHIQEERITKILDEAIYKTKLAICLPKLVQNYRILSGILTINHMDDLTFIFEQYDNPLFSASLLNMAAIDDIKSGDISLKNRLNPELGHLLYILNSYPALKPVVEEMVEKMREEYIASNDEPDRSPVPVLEYLLAFERFRDIMVAQMQATAAEQLAQKLYVRKLEESNAKLLAKIAEYEEIIDSEQKRFDSVMSGKQQVINELEEELKWLNKAAAARLKKKVLDSDRQMVLMSRAHAVKHELLKDEEAETQDAYNTLLHHHIMEEAQQRARRFKVQTQLLSWIQKYDTEMLDKQEFYNELEDKYKDEISRIEELTKRLAEQDLEYIPLMEERDAEYQAEMQAKMTAFRKEHAARVIQNAWRQVQINRAEKKKLRALWKKKKAEMEKAERLEAARLKKAEKEAKKQEKEAKKAAKEAEKAAKKAAKEKKVEEEEKVNGEEEDEDD